MEQQPQEQYMPHECFEDALKEDVRACGGPLKVAKVIYGSAVDEQAGRIKLLNALNPERPEKPSLAAEPERPAAPKATEHASAPDRRASERRVHERRNHERRTSRPGKER